MPTFLLHGFRWPRENIRDFFDQHSLSKHCDPEWLMSPGTGHALRGSMGVLFPDAVSSLLPDRLHFVEQKEGSSSIPRSSNTGPPSLASAAIASQSSPTVSSSDGTASGATSNGTNTTARTSPTMATTASFTTASTPSQPFAYVADAVREVTLGADIDEVRGNLALEAEAWEAVVELRDTLAPGERVAWYVVICDGIDSSVAETNYGTWTSRAKPNYNVTRTSIPEDDVGLRDLPPHGFKPKPPPLRRTWSVLQSGGSQVGSTVGSTVGSVKRRTDASAKTIYSSLLKKSKSLRDLSRKANLNMPNRGTMPEAKTSA